MKNKLLLLIVTLFSFTQLNAQVFWTEDFGTGCSQGNTANTYAGPNGAWSVNNVGANDPEANEFYVSATEAGMGAGNCGDGCISNGTLNNRTLHIGSNDGFTTPDPGAAYNAGGICGLLFCVATDKRAESSAIDCSGQTGITLDFNYMENGDGTNDDATLWYFDGATWSQLDPLAKTPVTCSPQGTWTAFSIGLPASADNNPNVKIGFRWVNNDDGVGTDPSFAVDDITLSTTTPVGPNASFTPDNQTICEGDCVTYTDNSSTSDAGGITSWTWSFPGGTPNSFNGQNPPCIDYTTAGTYSVELTVTDANASDDTITIANYITVESGPDAGTNGAVTFCDTDAPSDLINELGGTPDAGGAWTPAMASGTGVFDPSSDTPGTYTYTVTSTNSCPDATAEVDVTVNTCNTTTASFSADNQTICAGDCINFADLSASPNTIVNWDWTFTGGAPSTFNGQAPGCVTYNTPGTYAVELSVTDDMGVTDDTVTIATYITVEAPPNAGNSATVSYCDNDPVTDLFNELGGTPDAGGSWSPATSAGGGMFEPGVDAPGIYTYTVSSTNSCPDASATVDVSVNNCNQPTAGFTASSQTICQGECVTFNDISTGTNINSWEWDFSSGGDPTSFSGQNPPQVCYDQPGTYTVTLTITDDVGTDDMTMTITVNPGPSPEITQNSEQCEGNTVTLTTGLSGNHTWSDNSTNTTLDVTTDGTYWVDVDDGSGCIGSDTIKMTFHDELVLELTAVPETCIDAEDGTVITEVVQGDGPLSYSWLNGDTSSNPSFAPGIYTVSVVNDYGCQWKDTVEIEAATEECPEPSVYIPNIFSPNGDGINDFFEVYGNDIAALTVQVFDRWGKMVFYSTSLDAQWDGERNGKPMNTAVFAYLVNVTYSNGIQEEYSGNVTLVRKK